jgi:hypothetical protein
MTTVMYLNLEVLGNCLGVYENRMVLQRRYKNE